MLEERKSVLPQHLQIHGSTYAVAVVFPGEVEQHFQPLSRTTGVHLGGTIILTEVRTWDELRARYMLASGSAEDCEIKLRNGQPAELYRGETPIEMNDNFVLPESWKEALY